MADEHEASVTDIRDHRKKKQTGWDIEGIMQEMSNQFGHAESVAEEFCTLLSTDPVSAVNQIGKYIDKAREWKEGARGYEAYVGGPCEYNTAPILRAVGTIYAGLERPVREIAFRQCLNFLDGLRYDLSQTNVEYIDEPWLAGDIVINRGLYWCGFKEYTDMLEKTKIWKDLLPMIEKTHSRFWLAMAISRPEYASLDIRTHFMNELPILADRTQDAIAGITYTHALIDERKENILLKQGIESRLKKYDTLWLDAIQAKIKEQKWILDMDYFNGRFKYKEPEPKKVKTKLKGKQDSRQLEFDFYADIPF